MLIRNYKNKRKSKLSLYKLFYAIVLLGVLVVSCNEDYNTEIDSIEVTDSKDWVLPYTFDWEDPNLNWMPYPSGGGVAAIPPPWTGQGGLADMLEPDVLADRKASDGWELVYSTFDPDPARLEYNPYFVLYNKYRGIMRVFLYVNNSSNFSSTFLKDVISQSTDQYSILNFDKSEIVDVATNRTQCERIGGVRLDGTAPYAPFRWYMFQYEFAYDPQLIPTLTPDPPQISININSIDVTEVNLGGTQTGSLKGSIGATGPTGIFSNLTSQIAPIGKGVFGAIGASSLSKFADGDTSNTLGLNNSVFKATVAGMNSLVSAASAGVPGTVFNLLSGIFGGSSASAGQSVSLNLETDISLAGSITSTTALPSTPILFYFPGSLLADNNGNYNVTNYVPKYNKPLGVFNITAKPTVKLNYSCFYGGGVYNQLYQYTLDNSSFDIVYNPEVLANASISSVEKDVVIITGENDIDSYFVGKNGYQEIIQGKHNCWTAPDYFEAVYRTPNATPRIHFYKNEVYLRISFIVTPNDGAPPVTIVKTFAVDKQILNNTY